jgi:hypothetical protein
LGDNGFALRAGTEVGRWVNNDNVRLALDEAVQLCMKIARGAQPATLGVANDAGDAAHTQTGPQLDHLTIEERANRWLPRLSEIIMVAGDAGDFCAGVGKNLPDWVNIAHASALGTSRRAGEITRQQHEATPQGWHLALLGQPGQFASGGNTQERIGLVVASGAPLQVGGGDDSV